MNRLWCPVCELDESNVHETELELHYCSAHEPSVRGVDDELVPSHMPKHEEARL